MTAVRTLYDRLIDSCGFITAGIVLFLTFGITIDVALRTLRMGEVEWMLELSEYSLLAMTFLGAPWALREGAHVRVDVVLSSLPRSAVQACEIIADILGLCASAILLVWGSKAATSSAASGSMVYKVLIFPEWWLYALIAFSSALLTIEFFRRLLRALSGSIDVPAPPEML